MNPRDIVIDDFNYELPDQKIAKYPLAVRHESKLLVSKPSGIQDSQFQNLPQFLESEDLIIINNTRVIPARLHMYKDTGGMIEIFCLDPVNQAHQDAMAAGSGVRWKCLVGGAKKWKDNQPLALSVAIDGIEVSLLAYNHGRSNDAFIIEFVWGEKQFAFSQILDAAGRIPLPPYFNREAELSDIERYQTIFAKYKGSVAAPTASLHFTDDVFDALRSKGVITDEITLHVGAGTFKPVNEGALGNHEMHDEWFSVPLRVIQRLRKKEYRRLIVAGTTAMRTLESLYPIGVKLLKHEGAVDANVLAVKQWEVYQLSSSDVTREEALDAILEYMQQHNLENLCATSALLIAPGFQFQCCDAIITNFHQPKSTLLVLVSAFVGDRRKQIYDHALNHDYRFLSYGDSSLLWREG
jgi:S-adenosylmethionine:tRNA ribosyltransferase-isomerase